MVDGNEESHSGPTVSGDILHRQIKKVYLIWLGQRGSNKTKYEVFNEEWQKLKADRHRGTEKRIHLLKSKIEKRKH